MITSVGQLAGVAAKAGARVTLKTATSTHFGTYTGAGWDWFPAISYPVANLPAATGYPLGAQLIITGAFASDVSQVLLTCDMVKNVKSWTGQVVSVTTNTGPAVPPTVTWTTTP
ncbi:MAG: hypothetical protein ACRCTP_04080 [Aeromonas popoffii]|uniref:hypothetical protein n=1 Tax=Aeromonas popoffii TaxID=70856 RepID=UPI003F2F37CD